MPTVRPSGAGGEAVGLGEVVNGGTVIHGGSNAAGIMTKNLSLADIADDQGQDFGSKVLVNAGSGNIYTDRAGVSQARAGQAGTVAYQAGATEWVVKGGNVTQTLGGIADTSLIGGAAGPDSVRDGINQLETTRDYGDVDIDVFAAPASGISSYRTITGGGVEVNFIRPSGAGDENSNDLAANTSRAIPGQLIYRTGAALPKEDAYKSKESPES